MIILENDNIKNKAIINMAWRFAERSGAQIVSFIVSIVLARILLPSEYGTIALISVFTTILQVFVDSGLGNALIQKKEVDDLDYSTVFYFNMALCVFLYLLIFFFSTLIGKFYNDMTLVPLIRVASLSLLISGVKSIQQAYVSKNLIFKRFFYSTLGGTIISAIVGIFMAYKGFGCWALIIQQLTNLIIDTLILWFTVEWRPKLIFSFSRLRSLFSYGWKILVSALIDTSYNNLRSLIIGKFYSSSDLAYYNKGKQFPTLIVTNINTSIDSVLLPVMASAQDDKSIVKTMTRKSIKTSSFIMWPLMFGLAICAEPLVVVLLTEKWIKSVFFLRVFCFTYALWPIHTANLNAIKAMGRSDMFLKLEIIKKIVGLISIILTIPFGVHAMAIGYFITGPINALINAFPNKTLLDYSFKEQVDDLLPYIFLAFFMSVCIWPIQYLPLGNISIICLQMFFGGIIYLTGARICKFDVYFEIVNIIKRKK